MRRIRTAVCWGLIALTPAACGGSRPHLARTRTIATSRAPAARRPITAIPPGLIRLRAALESALRAAGPATGGLVYDIASGRTLFELRSTTGRPPASVEKLYTTVAVLDDLGPAAELQTSVLGLGHLGPGGVWHGNLYLHGDGDPTFGDGTFNRVWEEGYGPTAAALAGQLRQAGIRSVTGRVIGDASLFDPRPGVPSSAFAPDIPDLGGELAALTYDHGAAPSGLSPGAFAARQLARALRSAGIRARPSRHTGVTPPGAQPLATASSPPMSVLVKLTDVPSDDFFAEMLTKQLGVRFGGAGSTAAGAAVITQVANHLGLTPTIVDGSGLSRQDRTSPLQVVDLLRSVWGSDTGRALLAALPVVGVDGTVARLAVGTPAQGHCQAKTGTLNYVTNLAGYCERPRHHVLAFALFIDGPANTRASMLIGRMVAAIARY